MGVATKILAFDSSSGITGWALLTVPISAGRKIKLLKFGHFKIKSAVGKKTRPIPERLVEFGECIEDLIRQHSPAYVAFEEHHISKIKAAKTLFKFMGVGLEIAYRYTKREVIEMTPREIRTNIGINWMSRDIAKELVKKEIENFFNVKVKIDDESDAIALAIAAAGKVRILEGRE
jgi:Holliday junction resolvasome RuvABC endonuclease subunit